MIIKSGLIQGVRFSPSPFFNQRPDNCPISLIVIHNISLPPEQFSNHYIEDLFLGKLDPNAHEYFKQIYKLEVSAHVVIYRDGNIVQYVNFNDRAWHAGVSVFNGKEKCNDFSIGIELEGSDNIPFTDEQYKSLIQLVKALKKEYKTITDICGHSTISPGRKTDPGPYFQWDRLTNGVENV